MITAKTECDGQMRPIPHALTGAMAVAAEPSDAGRVSPTPTLRRGPGTMADPRSVPSRPGPEHVLSSAKDSGAHLRLQASQGSIQLQQYDCEPGGWRHGALTSWRIAFQQAGAPRIQRVVERSSERQWRPPGKISISRPDAQSWSWDSRHRVAILFIGQDIIDGVTADAGMDGRLRTPLLVEDALIRQVILEILSECTVTSRISPLLLESAGRHVAAHLLARYSGASPKAETTGMAPWKLRRALDYIEENIDRDIGLEELSKIIDMNPHYFCRSFRKSVGTPPYRYLLDRRIERSKELLACTEQDVTEIGLKVGFSSHSHFSTAFRRAVGHTPSTYRNAVRS
jgi:AraC family transcriptional regulator